ncbi:hypothetical protein Ga0100231_005450 [Opitutaceae bacterium TAV4]|nr:hypothetical protein Ga0100231_005450 [Opitutaceae bacterium TAV4]
MLARISTTWRRSLQPISLSVQVAPNANGKRIPLIPNWKALIDTIRTTGEVVIQTRHRHARFISRSTLPDFIWDAPCLNASADNNRLHLHTAHWTRVFGRARNCPCCGSPGGVSIHDQSGTEFLQICAPAGASATRWTHLLEEWRADKVPLPPPPPPPPCPDSLRCLAQPATDFPAPHGPPHRRRHRHTRHDAPLDHRPGTPSQLRARHSRSASMLRI